MIVMSVVEAGPRFTIQVVTQQGLSVTVANPPVPTLVRTNIGVPGPKGDPGPMGPAGPSGLEGYTHTQVSAASTWTLNHNLGYRPAVDLADSGGMAIDAAVLHVSLNQLVVTFVTPTAGTARLT